MEDLESVLRGKTLKVYLYLLEKSGSTVGVREVQRKLGLSSPSLAAYHLDKLVSLGLANKTPTGEYYLAQEVKIGILKFFVRLGRFRVPRFLFYGTWMTSMLLAYVVLYGITWDPHCIVALVFGLLSSAILWAETMKLLAEARSKT